MCLYLIDNPDNIEAESLTESVERQVFQAMNKAISMRVGDRTPWRGQYALVSGDDEEHEETWFACAHWPYKANGDPLVCFRLWENEGDNGYWLSQALGVNGGSMCFEFRMVGKTGGPSLYKIKKAMKEFYEQNAGSRRLVSSCTSEAPFSCRSRWFPAKSKRSSPTSKCRWLP